MTKQISRRDFLIDVGKASLTIPAVLYLNGCNTGPREVKKEFIKGLNKTVISKSLLSDGTIMERKEIYRTGFPYPILVSGENYFPRSGVVYKRFTLFNDGLDPFVNNGGFLMTISARIDEPLKFDRYMEFNRFLEDGKEPYPWTHKFSNFLYRTESYDRGENVSVKEKRCANLPKPIYLQDIRSRGGGIRGENGFDPNRYLKENVFDITLDNSEIKYIRLRANPKPNFVKFPKDIISEEKFNKTVRELEKIITEANGKQTEGISRVEVVPYGSAGTLYVLYMKEFYLHIVDVGEEGFDHDKDKLVAGPLMELWSVIQFEKEDRLVSESPYLFKRPEERTLFYQEILSPIEKKIKLIFGG